MPAGFFSASTLQTARAPAYSVPRCGQCGLLRGCTTPKMPYAGRGERGVLIIGDAPDRDDDKAGKPFRGEPGQKLTAVLGSFGVDLSRDCWRMNALSCHPHRNKIDNNKKIEYCRPLVNDAIAELRPAVIIPLGAHAVRSVVGPAWREDVGEIDRWVGWQIPLHKPNVWVCPTWHPRDLLKKSEPVADLWFRRHLKKAFKLSRAPWPDGPPDYEKQITIYPDPDAAAKRIRALMLLGDFPATFDIETTTLKPDSAAAKIVCASICWEGKTTIAFPFRGAAVDAFKAFLRSPALKRGYNQKFESRWSYAKLGVWPRNWEWDGMLAAHTADNRRGICSLKFQAFVRLGQGAYNNHIAPFLKGAGGGNDPNRIGEVDFMQLALYCGLDSVLEWHVSEHQRRELGYGMD